VATFQDALGREWRIELDCFLLDRIDKEAAVDLGDLAAGGLLAIEREAKALGRVLAVVCDEQLKELRMSPAEFQKQIRKDAITRAKEAVREALADFFPENEWSAMQSNLTTRKNQPEMTPEQLQLATGFLRMAPEVQRDVMGLIRDETDGRGNLPTSQESESVVGLGGTPETPASDSPASATSAPEGTASGSSG